MKTIDQLTKKAIELQKSGLLTGQIADELNISRETATWLLLHSKKGNDEKEAPRDIYIDWSNIGKNSIRQKFISCAIADMISESTDQNIDVVVGIALSGIPLANKIAEEFKCEFATYHPNKQRWEPDTKETKGAISQNFANVEGKNCVIIDDVVTSGTTLNEAVSLLRQLGANPISIAVMIDKKGIYDVLGVPLNSLIRIKIVDKTD